MEVSAKVREPTDRIGREVLFENGRVRVWDMPLAPGESSDFHHHVHDYLFIYVVDSRLEINVPGESPVVREFAQGFVQVNVVGVDGLTHQIKNVGTTAHRQILVEFLGPSASTTPLPPETNGRAH
ncbi:MAG TPA: hypothetical protein DEV93_22140 [Chloroflexi bacterium]|nr:hypothetical protein [Chloroflexota bacterium]